MVALSGLGMTAVAAAVPFALARFGGPEEPAPARPGGAVAAEGPEPGKAPAAPGRSPGLVRLTAAQQGAIGLEVARAEPSPASETIEAPGRVTPDETRYAYITPRASGVVRSVSAQIGQEVREGQLLATLDSTEVAQARFDLLTKAQALEVAQAKADWQEGITAATLELIDRLQANDAPEEIRRRFEGRAIGADRERLLTADAQRRLTWASLQRNKELLANDAVALSKYQVVQAEYEAALATYQGLMDRVGVETRLANTLAQQDRRQAMTADRVARERLRALGVTPEPDDADAPSKPEPAQANPSPAQANPSPAPPGSTSRALPLDTYTIRAPFDGTILDREMIVPGVAVGTMQRIFTMADLRSVWIEANIHESHFGKLGGSYQADVILRSPAYPGKEFTGKVLYTGDIVDEKSRMVKLLAHADNPGRALKPGMYVDVSIRSRTGRDAVVVPDTAVLTEDGRTFVYVRTDAEQFARRDVRLGEHAGGQMAILDGLSAGDEVVSRGAFKLKAEAIRLAGG